MREVTLYQRDPDKNYAFVKVGKVECWASYCKLIRVNGQVYTLTQPEVD